MLDNQGTYLFDIFNPEVLPRDVSLLFPSHPCCNSTASLLISLSLLLSMLQGFMVIQMDFGFPHHLLVEFLKKTLQ